MSVKISIGEQIKAVSGSAMLARAAGEYSGDKAVLGRADCLDAAVKTLAWVRDNAETLAQAVKQATAVEERRRLSELPLAQQAALRCADARFQKFMRAADADEAARAVRAACKVASRAEFDTVVEAGAAWRRVDAEFSAWLRGYDQTKEVAP